MSTHSQTDCHRIEGADAFFAGHGYLQVPHLVQWMATLRCGLKCEHCLAAGEQAGLMDMPLDKTKGLIDEVSDLGVDEFLLTGGEPLVREDLSEVISYLGHRQVNWTLNTAAMPSPELCEVINQHRPGFVAVSLDGPKAVHDGFRGKVGAYEEALESIAYFKSLGIRVCAGTTVTTRNYPYLEETFHLAVDSGADQWGIHLLVPEGRAAERKDLFLNRSQLKRLVKLVAHKRRSFDVGMADEIGYLGIYEPLVRDIPLQCGAGRSQCVILPDGSVVPCTTLDRTTSAGNLYEHSLQQIWTEGFQAIRSWRPTGKCGHCDYASACKGGCWLQRKAGTQCFKDVWHVPGTLKTAAGIAICLGALGGMEGEVVMASGTNPTESTEVVIAIQDESDQDLTLLEDAINQWYFDQAALSDEPLDINTYVPDDVNDPGWLFFSEVLGETLPESIVDRCELVDQALDTQQKSLSLAALCWRVVNQPLLDPNGMALSDEERDMVQSTLFKVRDTAEQWRNTIFSHTLDEYLANGRQLALPICSSSGHKSAGPTTSEGVSLQNDLNVERWGMGGQYDCLSAGQLYIETHPYGEPVNLVFSFLSRGTLIKHTNEGTETVSSEADNDCAAEHTIGPFDAIETQEDVVIYFKIMGAASGCNEDDPFFNESPREYVLTSIPAYLVAGKQYTYGELLQSIYQENRDLLVDIARAWLKEGSIEVSTYKYFYIDAVYMNAPLTWPALRELILNDSVTYTPSASSSSDTLTSGPTTWIYERAMLKDIDFWMF